MTRYTTEQKQEILTFAHENTIKKACEKFSVSKYAINEWKGWTRKNKKLTNKKWYDAHAKHYYAQSHIRARQNDAMKKYRKENFVKERDRNRKSRRLHVFERMAEYANRAAKRKDGETSYKLKAIDIWKIAKRQRNLCAISGIKLHRDNLSLDHIVPRIAGGSNKPDNLQLLHRWVNIAKYDQTQEDFLALCNIIASRHPTIPDIEKLTARNFIPRNQFTLQNAT